MYWITCRGSYLGRGSAMGWGLPSLNTWVRGRWILIALALSVSPTLGARAIADQPDKVVNEVLVGRAEFDHPAAAAPSVAVDLSAGLFRDFAGLGDAALAGVVEGVVK